METFAEYDQAKSYLERAMLFSILAAGLRRRARIGLLSSIMSKRAPFGRISIGNRFIPTTGSGTIGYVEASRFV